MLTLKRQIIKGATVISTGDATGGKKNKNGYAGIHFDNRSKKYRAEINHKRKKYHLGYSLDIDELIELRKEAEMHVKHGDFIDWYNLRSSRKNGKKN